MTAQANGGRANDDVVIDIVPPTSATSSRRRKGTEVATGAGGSAVATTGGGESPDADADADVTAQPASEHVELLPSDGDASKRRRKRGEKGCGGCRGCTFKDLRRFCRRNVPKAGACCVHSLCSGARWMCGGSVDQYCGCCTCAAAKPDEGEVWSRLVADQHVHVRVLTRWPLLCTTTE